MNRIRLRGWSLACLALFGLGCAAWSAPQAHAMLTQITIESVEPFANGAAFGAAGAYERVIGTARGQVDPADPRNRGIVNLERAPRNARGWVDYATEFYILRPADPAQGNATILYEVNNRGRKLMLTRFLDAGLHGPAFNNDPKTAADAGNGLFLRQGYTLVWSGWDPAAPRANRGLAMTAPVAMEQGRPIVREIREELSRSPRLGPAYLDAATFRLAYESDSLDPRRSRLTLRNKEADPKVELPPGRWAFVDSRTIQLLPVGTKPDPAALLEIHYPAKGPQVLGLGFAATRDFVSYLRTHTGADNPAPGVRHALGIGISQGGRFLRDFLGQGFNQDEGGRKVFDGMLTHIAGVGRLFLNAEFGQPHRTNTQHEDHFFPENKFPFSTAALADPVTGKRGSLFRNDGFDPLLIEVNTSTEYWQKGASLLTTDPLGQRDVKLPAQARVFLVAGTQHTGTAGLVSARGAGLNATNPHSPAPALRALLAALDAWVKQGVAPPPSRVPRIADGTAVPPEAIGFPTVPGVAVAARANAIVRCADWIHPVAAAGPQYRVLVPRVDADGNEGAGIRLPDIAAPLGTFTGWNLYRFPGLEGELCDRDGSYVPFAKTKAERLQAGDPRPSLEERYGTRAAYVALLAQAAQALVQERLLLPEDAQRYVEAASLSKAFD